MPSLIDRDSIKATLKRLRDANSAFAKQHPGPGSARQPVHTVYGGAHLFRHDSARKLGDLALRWLREYAPDSRAFAQAIGLVDSGLADASLSALAQTVYGRVLEKLAREPIEDFRIDFEDGYGNRPDAEEDACAASAAGEVALGMERNTLPPFLGIRIKPFSQELHERSIRTLDLFIAALLEKSRGTMPDHFVVTLPKVVAPEQVAALADLFQELESAHGLSNGSLQLEIMIETTQSIINSQGQTALPLLIAAGRGRCVAAHFGVYDYTACCNITAEHQTIDHPACDFARHMMQVVLTGTGIALSDGATNIMPVAPHQAASGASLTAQQQEENRRVVHRAWRLHYEHVRRSLTHAYYQGWDLNPAQLPTRYAALFAFFLESLPTMSQRLRHFVEKAAQATLSGDVFDDAATGQGLLNFFLRGLNCGAITESEALSTGLSLAELQSRSFVGILANRRGS